MNSETSRSKWRASIGLVGWIALLFLVSSLGALASITASDFYQELLRPSWAPPGWLFGPVWSTLFLLMAISAWLVWKEHGFSGATAALTLFLCQLVFNVLWSWLFFTWRLGFVAFVEILVLLLLICLNIFHFWRLHKVAAALLVPYLLWVSFAAVLNFSVWQLNPNLLG